MRSVATEHEDVRLSVVLDVRVKNPLRYLTEHMYEDSVQSYLATPVYRLPRTATLVKDAAL